MWSATGANDTGVQAAYVKEFGSEKAALDWMRMKNRATRQATGRRELFAVVPGPESGFAVVDLDTAIDLGASYTWEA
jgi:hypothetical protein